MVHHLTCPFVLERATRGRFVPLRLGTLWARHEVDMTVQVRALSGPRTYATADRLARLAWSTAQKLPAAVSLQVVVEAPLAGEGHWRRRPTTPSDSAYPDRLAAAVDLISSAIPTGRLRRISSGGVTADDMNASVWPNGRQVREPAGHRINFLRQGAAI